MNDYTLDSSIEQSNNEYPIDTKASSSAEDADDEDGSKHLKDLKASSLSASEQSEDSQILQFPNNEKNESQINNTSSSNTKQPETSHFIKDLVKSVTTLVVIIDIGLLIPLHTIKIPMSNKLRTIISIFMTVPIHCNNNDS